MLTSADYFGKYLCLRVMICKQIVLWFPRLEMLAHAAASFS